MTSAEKVKNVWRGFTLCIGIPLLSYGIANESIGFRFLGWAFLFLGAPYYAIAAGCLWFAILAKYEGTESSHFILAADFTGYAWVAAKMFRTVSEAKERDQREAEAAREQDNREEKLRKAAERKERVRDNAIRKERELDWTASAGMFKRISDLFSFCLEPASEMIRAGQALNGTGVTAPKLLVLRDIAAILLGFRNTSSPAGNTYIEKVCRGIAARHLRQEEGSLLDYVKSGDKPTLLVSVLACYDELQSTHTASQAASIFLGVVAEVADHCGDSLAVKLVTSAYIDMLKPYVQEHGGSNGVLCNRCIRGYELLGLHPNASAGEVKQKRRAWAEVLHPDQLGSKSHGARDAGEEQLKNINAACDHILQCRFSVASA